MRQRYNLLSNATQNIISNTSTNISLFQHLPIKNALQVVMKLVSLHPQYVEILKIIISE